MFTKFLASVLATGALLAQGCPDTTTRVVPTAIAVGPMLTCSSMNLAFDGVHVGDQATGCPTVVVVTPAHAESQHVPGCMTRTVADGQVQITKLFFTCEFSYFLFIKLGSSCVMTQRMNAGGLVTYKAIPCESVTKDAIDT